MFNGQSINIKPFIVYLLISFEILFSYCGRFIFSLDKDFEPSEKELTTPWKN